MEKPKPPLSRIIREGDTASKCTECGSSRHRFWIFFKTKYCIQPECKNYFKNFNKDKMKLIDAANCDKCKYYSWKDLSLIRYKVEAKCSKGYWIDIFYGDGEYAEQTSEHQMCEEFERK